MMINQGIVAALVTTLALSGAAAADGEGAPEEKVRDVLDKLWCFGAPAIVGYKVNPNYHGDSLGNGKFLVKDPINNGYGVFEYLGTGPGLVPDVVYAKYRVQGLAEFDSQKDFCQRGIMTPGHPLPF